MGDLFLEQDFMDFLALVAQLPKEQALTEDLKKKQSGLVTRFMQLPYIERAVLFKKLEINYLWLLASRHEVAELRLELLGHAASGTKVREILHNLFVCVPWVKDMDVAHPFFDMGVVSAMADLAEMEHRCKLNATQ